MSYTPVDPSVCPTPIYHETHRYCPSCTWAEPVGVAEARQPDPRIPALQTWNQANGCRIQLGTNLAAILEAVDAVDPVRAELDRVRGDLASTRQQLERYEQDPNMRPTVASWNAIVAERDGLRQQLTEAQAELTRRCGIVVRGSDKDEFDW